MNSSFRKYFGLPLAGVLLLAAGPPATSGSLGDFNLVTSYCPPRYLQFWDTVVFTVSIDQLGNSRGKPDLRGGTEYDIKVLRDVESVGDLRQLVAERLNTLGYVAEDEPVVAAHVGQLVHVNSSVVCGIPANLRLPSPAPK